MMVLFLVFKDVFYCLLCVVVEKESWLLVVS